MANKPEHWKEMLEENAKVMTDFRAFVYNDDVPREKLQEACYLLACSLAAHTVESVRQMVVFGKIDPDTLPRYSIPRYPVEENEKEE